MSLLSALLFASSAASIPCAFHDFPSEALVEATEGMTLKAKARFAATLEGVDPDVLGAVVEAESAFDPSAEGEAGEHGLAQLMPATAASMAIDSEAVLDPLTNLLGGACYLARQQDRFDTLPEALAAYNAGPGRAARSAERWPASTQSYVTKIMVRLGRGDELPAFSTVLAFASLEPSAHGFVGGIGFSIPQALPSGTTESPAP